MNIAQLILLGIQIGNAVSAGLPMAIKAKEAIDNMIAENRDPTDAEWAELNAVTDALRAKLHESSSNA
ncbi:hypothetical protein [Thalassospira alkalitolerans]|uniref:hypothetical protein n=1 Tax=Thalassospira alkalitolerans TaxID=1293890 RepID=UPI0030EE046E